MGAPLRVDLVRGRRRLRRRGTLEWRWIAKAANGRAIGGSLEGYANVADAVRGFASIRGDMSGVVLHLPPDAGEGAVEAVRRAVVELQGGDDGE